MKRHKSLIPLSRQHQRALITAQLIKKNAPEYRDLPKTSSEKRSYVIQFYYDHLVPHFKAEEEILIPFVEKRSKEFEEINEAIREEHLKIRELILEIESKNNYIDLMNELGFLLESHVRKEERIWFEKIQNILSEKELDELTSQMKLT